MKTKEMAIQKKPFRRYQEEESKKPLSVKLNNKDEEMLSIGMYAFNIHSKSGVLKLLAEIGLKVIREHLGVENMHKLTRSDRVKVIHEKPIYRYFKEKVE